MSNFTKLHLTHEIFKILPVFSQLLRNLMFIFSDSHEKFSLVFLQITNNNNNNNDNNNNNNNNNGIYIALIHRCSKRFTM